MLHKESALSFFKSFPWKCSTPLNGPANTVAVMSWTAVFLQDKLSCAMYLSVDFLARRLRGHERQLVMAAWKSLINFFSYSLLLIGAQMSPSPFPSPSRFTFIFILFIYFCSFPKSPVTRRITPERGGESETSERQGHGVQM